jgi:hypothetical protein
MKVVIKQRNEEAFLGPGRQWTRNEEDAMDFHDFTYALLTKLICRIDGEIICVREERSV